ncbi:MAG: helix-turn-helix domain-containing protein [Chloroflexi bacterium]|nr:helix-turn-helix domain-containing protein [Chloroflexota bacterium]
MTTRIAKKKQPKDLLSVGEAAEVLSVHPDTLRRWAAGGLLSVYRVGPRRDRRFHRSEVLRLMTSG